MGFLASPFHIHPAYLVVIGFCVGTMSSFFGVGGGWLVTPMLNILGLPMPYAIGSSLLYIIVASLFGTLRHRKLQNVNYVVGLIIGITAFGGILLGKKLILFLEAQGNVDTWVRVLYMVLLTVIGVYMLFEKRGRESRKISGEHSPFLKPVLLIRFEGEPIPLSVPLVVVVGIALGFLSSTMGVGGGFVLLPLLIYVVRLPVRLSIGTSLFTVLIAGIQGATVYILAGRVDWRALAFLIVTTIIGTFVGAAATKKVDPQKIKALFAGTVLLGVVAILFRQLEFGTLSNIAIITTALGSTAAIIVYAYVKKAS
jgi:uncharacterized membrane protein YfcA